MKKKLFISIFFLCITIFTGYAATPTEAVKEINQTQFKQLVSNYSGGYKNWSFKGTRPAIIDFYAVWCGPCKKLAPIVEELAKEYKGKIDFYKINIDNNPELAQEYQVGSIPMLLLAPTTGVPQIITGLYPKEEIIKAIDYVFWPKKK